MNNNKIIQMEWTNGQTNIPRNTQTAETDSRVNRNLNRLITRKKRIM